MVNRKIELSSDNREEVIALPINPTEFEFTAPQLNTKITLLNVGEVLLFGNRGVVSGTLASFFPGQGTPLYRYADREPQEYLRLLQKWQTQKAPVRLIVAGTDFNLMMAIDSLATRYREGDGDIYFTLTMSEYRKLNVPAIKEEDTILLNTGLKPRPSTKTPPKTVTVTDDDTAWGLAAKHYGDGAQYTKIKKKNPQALKPDLTWKDRGQTIMLQ